MQQNLRGASIDLMKFKVGFKAISEIVIISEKVHQKRILELQGLRSGIKQDFVGSN